MLRTWNPLLEFYWIMTTPVQFISSTMTERIKTLANKKTVLNKDITLNNDSNSNDQLKIKFTISYVHPLSEKFRNVIKYTVVVISFYSMNKLSNVIRT